jgi:hypothetical protein
MSRTVADARPRFRWLLPLAAAACSTLPPANYPPFVDHDVRAEYRVGDDGRLGFPVTTAELVVLSLQLDPMPLDERFDAAGQRWFVLSGGSAVTARCRLRVYSLPDGSEPLLAQVLPGAIAVVPTQ